MTNGVFENRPHARHELQIADDRAANALADGIRFAHESFHDLQKFRFEVGVVNREEQVFVAAFTHEVADAFIHGDASRSNQAGHAGDDAVIARRNHIRASAKDGDELKHIVVVGREHRRTGKKLKHGAAGLRVQSFHGHKNRKDIVTLAKSSNGLAEGRDVMAIFLVDFIP